MNCDPLLIFYTAEAYVFVSFLLLCEKKMKYNFIKFLWVDIRRLEEDKNKNV